MVAIGRFAARLYPSLPRLVQHRERLRLRALADSIEVIGAQSYYARDWRVHHHVRGLIASRAGRWAEAVREFEQARWTRTGWTRTLVEIARAELALGHPDRALVALGDARMTVLNSMGRYATHTEIALWTTRAYEAAGQLDSAQVYAAMVRRAWRNADPSVRRQLAWLVPESQSNARVAVAVPPMGAKLDEAAARSFNDLRRRK